MPLPGPKSDVSDFGRLIFAELGNTRVRLGEVKTREALSHFIVGMTNSAPCLMPEGQRAVTVSVLV